MDASHCVVSHPRLANVCKKLANDLANVQRLAKLGLLRSYFCGNEI